MSALGEKRTCPSCSAKFYDLRKSPCICPKCGYSYVPAVEEAPKAKRSKTKRVEDFKDDSAKKKKEEQKKKMKKVISADDELGGLDLSEFSDAEEIEVGDHELEEITEIEAEDDIESLSDLEEREREEEAIDGDENDEEALMEGLEDQANIFDKPVEDEEEDFDEEEEDEDAGGKR